MANNISLEIKRYVTEFDVPENRYHYSEHDYYPALQKYVAWRYETEKASRETREEQRRARAWL